MSQGDYAAGTMPVTVTVRPSPGPGLLASEFLYMRLPAREWSLISTLWGILAQKEPKLPRAPSAQALLSPTQPSPQLQEAGCATVDGAAQLVQRIVQRHVRQLLPRGQQDMHGADGGSWAQGTATSCFGPAPTSVTTLRTPRIRSAVWNRPGLVLTASRTRPTKSRSWIGSTHRGPPSCRHTGARWTRSETQGPSRPRA